MCGVSIEDLTLQNVQLEADTENVKIQETQYANKIQEVAKKEL